MSRLAILLALCLALAAGRAAGSGPSAGPRDLAVVEGTVFGHPDATAVLVRDGRIVKIGSDDEVRSALPAGAPVIDADGGLVLPGLQDAHLHLTLAAAARSQADLSACTNVADVLRVVAGHARLHPDGWIRGRAWNYSIVPSGTFPTRQQLDAVVADRPVALDSYDLHAVWVNTKALAMAGVTAATRDPDDGKIVREPGTANPQGTLLDGATELVNHAMPEPTAAQRLAALEATLADCLKVGLTSVNSMEGGPETLDLLERLRRAGRLNLRVFVSLPLDGDLETFAALRPRFSGPFLRVGFLKGYLDGVVEARTAFLLEPYCKTQVRGSSLIPPAELKSRLVRAARLGFPVALHCIGDGAARLALDTVEAISEEQPGIGLKLRLEHLELIDTSDVPRLARLGVTASMQPYHANTDSPEAYESEWARNIGPDRMDMTFAFKSILGAHGSLCFGSDWPVASNEPLLGIHVAAARCDEEGAPFPQNISVRDAVEAYTYGVSRSLGREAELGRIEPGQLADLVVLSPGVSLEDPASFPKGKVRWVVVDGVVRHSCP